MENYGELVDSIINQLDFKTLHKLKTAVIIDDATKTPTTIKLDIQSLILTAVVKVFEENQVVGDQFFNRINKNVQGVTVTPQGDSVVFHVERSPDRTPKY